MSDLKYAKGQIFGSFQESLLVSQVPTHSRLT